MIEIPDEKEDKKQWHQKSKGDYARVGEIKIRTTKGFEDTLNLLRTKGKYKGKSKSVILHDALLALAIKNLSSEDMHIISTIQ